MSGISCTFDFSRILFGQAKRWEHIGSLVKTPTKKGEPPLFVSSQTILVIPNAAEKTRAAAVFISQLLLRRFVRFTQHIIGTALVDLARFFRKK